MYIIKLELKENWVFEHRNDDKVPSALIAEELAKDNRVKILDENICEIRFTFSDDSLTLNNLKNIVIEIIKENYDDCDDKTITCFDKVDAEDESEENDDEVGNDSEEKRNNDNENEMDDDDEVSPIDQINNLVGAKEYKKLANEIYKVSEEIRKTNSFDVFKNIRYLFSINDGNGLTTYLSFLADLIFYRKVWAKNHKNEIAIVEIELEDSTKNDNAFEKIEKVLTSSFSSEMKIVCIDISAWMDRTEMPEFKKLLKLIEEEQSVLTIFRIPFVEKNVLKRIERSLADVLTIKTVTFPPVNAEEMLEYAKRDLSAYGFTISDDAWEFYNQRITEEKSDGRFYGFKTIQKINRELIYQKLIKNVENGESSSNIEAQEAMTLCRNKDSVILSGEEMLNNLVGIDGVKQKIKEIIAHIEFVLKTSKGKTPCIHMRFVGNPGTGKTTVARIIGKILKERNVLRVGAFFEHSGRDFCGRYIGETAPKTSSICRDAYGSVLFIDEAYSLYRGDRDSKDYGKEALDTLIAEMENHRTDLVVIMAGYTKDIEILMKGNAGLESRMPYLIEFPNFTKPQLYDIFVSMVKDEYKAEEGLFESAKKYFSSLSDAFVSSKEFSNARYVRNLFERTVAKASMRMQLNDDNAVMLLKEDFELAISDAEFAYNVSKAKIGF